MTIPSQFTITITYSNGDTAVEVLLWDGEDLRPENADFVLASAQYSPFPWMLSADADGNDRFTCKCGYPNYNYMYVNDDGTVSGRAYRGSAQTFTGTWEATTGVLFAAGAVTYTDSWTYTYTDQPSDGTSIDFGTYGVYVWNASTRRYEYDDTGAYWIQFTADGLGSGMYNSQAYTVTSWSFTPSS